jgi:hypothetical protein
MISGQYVKTFAEASHALPQGMHMNADYPFMLPTIKSVTESTVTVIGRGGVAATATIIRRAGKEYFDYSQSSTFEEIYGRAPQSFRFHPFKDEGTPAIGQASSLFGGVA